MKFTHVTLHESVLGSMEEVRPICGPDPLVLGGLVLLLVVKLNGSGRTCVRVRGQS